MKISVLGLVLMMLIGGALVQAQEYRPETGTFIKDMQRNGLGVLTIVNSDNRMDAFAELTGLNKEPLIKVFIRAGESFTISGIEDGQYDMYFKLGNRWDQSNLKFLANETLYKLDKSLQFQTEETPQGRSYSAWTVALEGSVPNGNEPMQPNPVSQEEFPS